MKIDRVTITGADDKVRLHDLRVLQFKYPFVEWGILFSKSKVGQARYPSDQWVDRINDDEMLNLSAHLCGWYSRTIIEQLQPIVMLDFPRFKRFQINYSFNLDTRWITPLVNFAHKQLFQIILQYNKTNSKHILPHINNGTFPVNFNFLYDSSGGRGRMIKEVQPPFQNYYTGYSGGISPDNIKDVKAIITHMASNQNVWIDMESGVRTNNELDLNKVEEVLKICSL